MNDQYTTQPAACACIVEYMWPSRAALCSPSKTDIICSTWGCVLPCTPLSARAPLCYGKIGGPTPRLADSADGVARVKSTTQPFAVDFHVKTSNLYDRACLVRIGRFEKGSLAHVVIFPMRLPKYSTRSRRFCYFSAVHETV